MSSNSLKLYHSTTSPNARRARIFVAEKGLEPQLIHVDLSKGEQHAICRTEDYYVTRAETALLAQIAPKLATGFSPETALVEFGSGESAKTRILLEAAPQISVYIPVDISLDALTDAASRLTQSYPSLKISPVVADFTRAFQLPESADGRPRLGFFPGSTIGNFDRNGAVKFLQEALRILGAGSSLLIGIDLVKDEKTMIAAYNDSEGVTARFNKNLLTRINRELGGDFDLDAFEHESSWNAQHSRMEMHLVSRKDQIANAAGQTFAFRSGERLHTENSHKFTLSSFAELAKEAGWLVTRSWDSEKPSVAVLCLEPIRSAAGGTPTATH